MPTAKRILIVDDDESVRLLLSRILESIPGIEVTLANGGQEALKLIAEHAYDLVLLDLLMPEIDGIEVLGRIRDSARNKKTPVIVISVMSDADTQIVCRSLGVSEYLVKPIGRNAVLAAVSAQLGAGVG